MNTDSSKTWIKEFGLENRKPPQFFTDVAQLEDITSKVPQSQVLHRAFNLLDIDGVLCLERSPVVYFRQMKKADPEKIYKIHHSFWNQGIAPILAIITPDEVHIYSGLTPPGSTTKAVSGENESPTGFVQKLERVEEELRSFLLSVESGEYFHTNRRSFDPQSRVDRNLLRNLKTTREELGKIEVTRFQPQTLDALLCRLVFTCYLFDRGIINSEYLKQIDISYAEHLRDILATKTPAAKKDLYSLFTKLGMDFNGDLFTDDLNSESELITPEHLSILDVFFRATDIQTGQLNLWTYDFSFIPIETISAIYEHFLKVSDEEQKKDAGAFYTPRFLAEFVLDLSLENETSLLDKKFLDPACGSGIFLVGLFNRLAQEWKVKNHGARYDRRAQGLMDILQTNLFGVDYNPSACRITAFSLYLAFLDQLSPPDIQKLLGKWDRLPNLVYTPDKNSSKARTIYNIDFFNEQEILLEKVHYIIGNPPWGPVMKKVPLTKPEIWCRQNSLEQPNREKSVPFIWKAPAHLEKNGRVCFLLPHGILFNHNKTANLFQQSFFMAYSVERVVNLSDFQFFLFEESQAPALVIQYTKEKPTDNSHQVDYWVPKTDWNILQSEILNILPQDRSKIRTREIIEDLKGKDGPQVWKKRFWATPRDWRLLGRLSSMSRLRDIIGQPGKGNAKRWLIAEGFQPFGKNDKPSSIKKLDLPTKNFIEATSNKIDLFIVPQDCGSLPSNQIDTRRMMSNTSIFKAPHVLVAKGFSSIAFADFDVAFRHALRGIHSPKEDRELLIFLTAFLRSDLARYFLFHTSSNWGVYRSEVHVEELLRLPFPLPEQMIDTTRYQKIIKETAEILTIAVDEASHMFANREDIVNQAQKRANRLVEEYFDVDGVEQMLVADTTNIIIPSCRPSRKKTDIPTIKQSGNHTQDSYRQLLCKRLNGWADQKYKIHCKVLSNNSAGIGIAILEKTKCNEDPKHLPAIDHSLVTIISKLQKIVGKHNNTFELVRGLKIFDKNLLYITKPIGQRFWSQTAALNDADEIASTILMQSRERT